MYLFFHSILCFYMCLDFCLYLGDLNDEQKELIIKINFVIYLFIINIYIVFYSYLSLNFVSNFLFILAESILLNLYLL